MKILSYILCALLILGMLFGCEKKDLNKGSSNNKASGQMSQTDSNNDKSSIDQDSSSGSSEQNPDEDKPQSSTPPQNTDTPDNTIGPPIGTKYTREELMALPNVSYGYGPGVNATGVRPAGAINAQNKYGKYDAYFIAPESNNIYLTFDLGYEYNNLTVKILDVLKEKNVKAVFFITKSYCQNQWHDNRAVVQRIIDEGHVLGNHTVNHPTMPTLTIDQMEDEIMGLHNYVKDEFGYDMFLFRPPTGAYSERSLAVAQSLGYKTVNWSFAYYDYDTSKQPSQDEAYNTIINRAHPGAIYLLHAVSETNAAVLGKSIDKLRENYTLALFK